MNTVSRRRALVALVFVFLFVAGPALATEEPGVPRLRPTAADMQRARSVVLQPSDFDSYFRRDPKNHGQPGVPRCPGLYLPDRSDITITGAAESAFTEGNGGIGSSSMFFPRVLDVDAYWRRTVRPEYAKCMARVFAAATRPGERARVLQARPLRLDRVPADRVAAFRAVIFYEGGEESTILYRTSIFVSTGRGVVIIGIKNYGHECTCPSTLARMAAAHLFAAAHT